MVRISALALCVGVIAFAGAVYADGHSGNSTYGGALRWYFEAAAAGDARAQFLLGLKYETGTDVARDLSEAAAWYEKAARQDIPEAQFKLAGLIERGEGRAADPDLAAQWYERAALTGYGPAQYNLAILKLNSAASNAERIDGLVWLLRAQNQGIEAATRFLDRLEKLWPPALIAAAKQSVGEAVPGNAERAQ